MALALKIAAIRKCERAAFYSLNLKALKNLNIVLSDSPIYCICLYIFC